MLAGRLSPAALVAWYTGWVPDAARLRVQNFVFPNLPLPSYRRRDRAQLKMREFYISILQKRRESPEEVRRALPL